MEKKYNLIVVIVNKLTKTLYFILQDVLYTLGKIQYNFLERLIKHYSILKY